MAFDGSGPWGHFNHFRKICGTGDVDDSDAGSLKRRPRRADQLIETPGALAAPHDRENSPLWIETEESDRIFGFGVDQETRTQRGAGNDNFPPSLFEMRSAFLPTNQHFSAKSGIQQVGFAGNGIGFVDVGPTSLPPSGNQRSSGGESPHPQDDVRLEITNQVGTTPVSLGKSEEETRHFRRPGPWHCHRWNLFEPEVAIAFGREGVHLLLRYEEQSLMPAGTEHLGHGNAREQVTSGAAAGNHEAPGPRWLGSAQSRVMGAALSLQDHSLTLAVRPCR